MRKALFMPLENKASLRKRFLGERALQTQAEREQISSSITQRLVESTAFREAQCVFCYVSTAEEISTRGILTQAFLMGKTVCVPLCGAKGCMTARRITSLSELKPGHYGIPEPSCDAEIVLPEQISLAVIPALACDKKGYRLGYGGGYYDRFLAQSPALRAALCAEKRFVEVLPHEQFDQRCGLIFTERQVFQPNEKQ